MTDTGLPIKKVELSDDVDRAALFGTLDANLKMITEATGTEIFQRDDGLTLKGGDTDAAERILGEMAHVLRTGEKLDRQKAGYIISLGNEGTSYAESGVSKDVICFTAAGRPLKPKTIGQRNYVESIRKKDIVFGIGPAGTGKTYLAVAMAVTAFKNKQAQKRGEWEPVLRHSINLKAEEEKAQTGREVTSFFIADKFDFNTINIWKAVASVPLQSTVDKDKLTENVVIMPVSTEELCSLMDKEQEYDRIITDVHKLFEVDKSKFDIHWRDKFMESII